MAEQLHAPAASYHTRQPVEFSIDFQVAVPLEEFVRSAVGADLVADAVASTWSGSYASRWKHHADKGAVVSQRWP